jgi:hypothetical protein
MITIVSKKWFLFQVEKIDESMKKKNKPILIYEAKPRAMRRKQRLRQLRQLR